MKFNFFIPINLLVIVTLLSFSNSNIIKKDAKESTLLKIDTPKVVKFDFRNVNWAMNKHQVKFAEKTEPLIDEEDDMVYSDIEVAMENCSLFYLFYHDSLCSAMYIFETEKNNPVSNNKKFNTIKEKLSSKYGKPNKQDITNDTKWLINDCLIWLSFKKISGKLSLRLFYQPSKYLSLYMKRAAEVQTKGL